MNGSISNRHNPGRVTTVLSVVVRYSIKTLERLGGQSRLHNGLASDRRQHVASGGGTEGGKAAWPHLPR